MITLKSFICHLNDRKVRRRAAPVSGRNVQAGEAGDLNSSCPIPAQPALPKLKLCAVSLVHTNIFNTYLRKMIYICCSGISFPLASADGLLIFASHSCVSRTRGRRCYYVCVGVRLFSELGSSLRVCA